MVDLITWRGGEIEDGELLHHLPKEILQVLHLDNGFVVESGLFHFRGACLSPTWHSLREAWKGEAAFHRLYEQLNESDIPFGQDQFGDQYCYREGKVICLRAETGEVELFNPSFEQFLLKLKGNLEPYLNVSKQHTLSPGELLFVYPPFCFQESGKEAGMKAISASEVIAFHADLARQLANIPEGGKIELKLMENNSANFADFA